MKNLCKIFALLFIASSISACQNPGGQGGGISKQTGGTLIGGIAGGLLGAQVGKGSGRLVATGIGALAGALVGGSVGQSLDQYDQAMMQKSSHQALEFSPAGRAVEWNNPDSGHSGTITPVKTYKNNQGMYCREYTQEVNIGGKIESAYGKACRQPDGNWQIVK